jgi:hypothetical protein
MIITNNSGLPQSIFNAVSRQFHKKSDYSVTELLAPVQQVILKNRHDAEITEDCSERMWSLMGSAVHAVLQDGADKNTLTEENLKIEMLGKTISGSPDYFDGKVLQDYKFTSAWTIVYGDRDAEHEAQLNCYAYLYRKHGFNPEKLQIVYILRDWSKSKAKSEQNYPQSQVVIKDFKLWDEKEQGAFIGARVMDLIAGEKMNPLPCTPEQQWRSSDVYAVMKEGRKSAVKLFDKESEAETFKEEKGKGHTVVKRPGEPKRCNEYCAAREFCEQAKKEKGE